MFNENEKYIWYRCELCFINPNFHEIKNELVSILGEPKERGLLHPFFVVGENGEEDGEGFQLKLTSENLEKLQTKCVELNISFEEVFERDWRHFHLNYYNRDDEHEGTAYEHDEFWELYYEDGSLSVLPGLSENNFLIKKIYKEDINDDLDKIHVLFEKWVKENIK